MAVSQDRVALRLMGANPVQIKTIAFGVGIAAASLAGALLIMIAPVIPSTDRDYIGRMFAITVLGGMGSIGGTLVAAAHPRGGGEPDGHVLRPLLVAGGLVRHPPAGARRAAGGALRALDACARACRAGRGLRGGRGGLRARRPALNPYFYFAGYVILQYVVIATAWNILGGYAGYVNFGTPAFFAMGAYTAVFLIQSLRAPLPVLLLAGGLVAALARPRHRAISRCACAGTFFSIATLALSVVLQTVIINWDYVGGSRGISVIRPPGPPFGNYVKFLFMVMLGLAVVAVLAARFIERSWIGRGLAALRDNEEAAECMGVPTLRLKLFATTVSGFLLGVAGAPVPVLRHLRRAQRPRSALDYAVNALAMPMIGGTTSWIGPVIGAVLLGTAQQVATVTISSELNLLIVGVVLVAFVVLAPEGILGLVRRLRGR